MNNSVIGQTFNCGKCGTPSTLTSEGRSFICPNCNTSNALPGTVPSQGEAATNILKLVVGLITIGVALWALFSF